MPTPTVSTQGGNAPAGYMGVLARLYSESGHLYWSVGPTYTSGASAAFSTFAGDQVDLNQNFYSDGTTYAYNGNGYNAYSSLQSPFILGSSN